MEESRTEIIAGIRELRAKAIEQLTGNEFYMIAQQLDLLENSANLSDETTRSLYQSIQTRLDAAVPSASAAENPEAPTASAEDGPQPIISPRANSFSAPQATAAVSFATDEETDADEDQATAEETAPAALQGGLRGAADAVCRLAQQELSGNRYYIAVSLLGALRDLPGAATNAPSDGSEPLALLRQEAGHLSGDARGEAERLTQLVGLIFAAERGTPLTETAQETPAAPAQAELRADAAAEPEPEPEPEAKPETLAPLQAPPKPEGPLTGFDRLAQASWERVEAVIEAERTPPQGLNGITPPQPSATTEAQVAEPVEQPAAAPAPVSSEAASQDKGEAFDDGGSERRSSEPCYAGEFEQSAFFSATPADHEPAGDETIGQTAEAQGETAIPAETKAVTETEPGTEAVSAPAAAETSPERAEAALEESAAVAEPGAGTEEEIVRTEVEPEPAEATLTVVTETVVEAVDTITVQSEQVASAEAEPQTSETPAATPDTAATVTAESPPEETSAAPAASEEETSEATAELSAAEQPPALEVGTAKETQTAPEAPAASSAAGDAEETKAEAEKTPEKRSRAGFLSRLFGGRASEHR
jgi:hypothetical protein